MMLCPLCFVPWLGSPVTVPVWFIPKKGTFNEEIIDRSGCQEGLASNLSLLTHKVNPGRSHLFLFLQPQFSAGMRPVVHSFEWGQKGYRNEIVGVTLLWKLEGSIHRCQGFCAWPCTFEILVRFTLKTTLLLPLNLLMKQYANVCVCVSWWRACFNPSCFGVPLRFIFWRSGLVMISTDIYHILLMLFLWSCRR